MEYDDRLNLIENSENYHEEEDTTAAAPTSHNEFLNVDNTGFGSINNADNQNENDDAEHIQEANFANTYRNIKYRNELNLTR
jgi:hypothetical protein